MFPIEANQILASGAVAAEDEVADEEGIVEVDVTAVDDVAEEDVAVEEDVTALDIEEETTALELVTSEEVVVEVPTLDEVTDVLVKSAEVVVEVPTLDEVTDVLVTLEVVIEEEFVITEDVLVSEGPAMDALEEVGGREESTLDVIFSGEQLASNVNKRIGMTLFIWISIFQPSLRLRA